MAKSDELPDFVDRLNQILDHFKITPYRLAKDIGSSDAVLSSLKSGATKPSYDFLSKLLSKYEIINGHWLITGQGEMIKKSDYTPMSSGGHPVVMEGLGEYTPIPKGGYNRAVVSPNMSKTVSPTVSPTHKMESFAPCQEAHYRALSEEKERIIKQQAQTIEVLQISLGIMKDRIEDLEASRHKKGD